MLLTVENSKDKSVIIYDSMGRVVKGIMSYDTETKECEMVVFNSFDLAAPQTPMPILISSEKDVNLSEVLKIKTTLPGSYATVDGERV